MTVWAGHVTINFLPDDDLLEISMDTPSGSRVIHRLDTSNALQSHRVNSYNKRTYLCAISETTALTMWAGRVTVNSLPEDVLLHIFYFDRLSFFDGLEEIDRLQGLSWSWRRLVHVCRTWRSVIFASPTFLDLSLVCGPRTSVELTGSIWPPFPISIRDTLYRPMPENYDFDAAIEHHNRVYEIVLHHLKSLDLQRLASAMQKQFPALMHLMLAVDDGQAPVLPDGFLGGYSPRMQSFELDSIPFPALPKLLLSTTHLVRLSLWDIPHSGYISPNAIVTCLSTLTSLEELTLEFQSPQIFLDQARRYLQPLKRFVLPALIEFRFQGVCEYLNDLVAHIDAPQLNKLSIIFFNDIVFDTPQLVHFIGRIPTFSALKKAHLVFSDIMAWIHFSSETSGYGGLDVEIYCREFDWQISSLQQICTLSLSLLSKLEDLYIHEETDSQLDWQRDIENSLWLELLHPFTAVKNLYLSDEFAHLIVPALQELVGVSVTELLPTLQNIFLEGFQPSIFVQEGVRDFIARRQTFGHRIAVSRWE